MTFFQCLLIAGIALIVACVWDNYVTRRKSVKRIEASTELLRQNQLLVERINKMTKELNSKK